MNLWKLLSKPNRIRTTKGGSSMAIRLFILVTRQTSVQNSVYNLTKAVITERLTLRYVVKILFSSQQQWLRARHNQTILPHSIFE